MSILFLAPLLILFSILVRKCDKPRFAKIFLILIFICPSLVYGDDELIPLSVDVNTENKGDYIVVLRDQVSILISLTDLNSLGMIPLDHTDIIDDIKYLDLDTLDSHIEYRIDHDLLILQLDVNPKLLKKTRRNLVQKTVVKSNPLVIDSAFLNASAHVRGVEDKSYRAIEFPLEGVVSVGDLLFQTNFTYIREDIDGVFVTGTWFRGMSSVTKDFTKRLSRLTVGDFSSSSGEMGGSGVFGGISFGKQFDMATYFTKYPSLTVDGVLSTPSKVDLYANGNLIRSEALPAGEFELTNLPDLYGAGELVMEIEDAFGRKQRRNLNYYVSTRLLREGLHEYNYSLGFRRSGLNKPPSNYAASATFIGFHRYGFSEYLTMGFRFEAQPDLRNYGPTMNLLFGSLGELEFKLARSEFNQLSAHAFVGRYNFTSRYFHLRLGYRKNQENYTTISTSATTTLADEIFSGGIGVHGTRFGGLSLSATKTNYYHDLPQEVLALNYSTRLGRKVTFFLRAQQLKHASTYTKNIFASINITIGRQVSASASYSQSDAFKEYAGYLQKSVPVGEGTGFRFRTRRIDSENTKSREFPGDLNLIGKTRHGVLSATYFKEKFNSFYNLHVASTLAFVDNNFFVTRPIYDSFGLVKVGDLDEVDVFYSNELVGKTKNGQIIIPNLTSYADNYLSIAAEDIPVDYGIGTTRKVISPKFRTGSVAAFDVAKFQGFFGYLSLDKEGKVKTADFAELKIQDASANINTTVGKGGEFYFENLPPGKYRTQVKLEGELCVFQLEIPKSQEMLVELGNYVCKMQ